MIPGTTSTDVRSDAEIGAAAGLCVLRAIDEVLEGRARCLLAVPGGTTPEPVFRWLAERVTPDRAARIDVIPVDERHQPVLDGPVTASTWAALPAESNLRLLWEHWLQHTSSPPTALPLDAPGSLAEALASVAATVVRDPDVVLLGLGPDGHVASLFPGHPALDDRSGARVLAVADSPKPPPERLTFALGSLRAAHTVVVVARGVSKADAVRAWADLTPSHPLPRLVGPVVRAVVDPGAASLLESR